MPRFSIARLMVVVGVIALNIAAVRALFSYGLEMFAGAALSGIVLQIGLFRFKRNRDGRRAFWAGFVVCGLMAMIVFISAMRFPDILRRTKTGTIIRTPGSSLYLICNDGYANFVTDQIGFISNSILGDAFYLGIRAIVWFLPQLLAAVAGGLLTSLIDRWGKMRAGVPMRRPPGSPSLHGAPG
jgi:multisubunit Na+/H+ antiporter MnhG subunit